MNTPEGQEKQAVTVAPKRPRVMCDPSKMKADPDSVSFLLVMIARDALPLLILITAAIVLGIVCKSEYVSDSVSLGAGIVCLISAVASFISLYLWKSSNLYASPKEGVVLTRGGRTRTYAWSDISTVTINMERGIGGYFPRAVVMFHLHGGRRVVVGLCLASEEDFRQLRKLEEMVQIAK